MGYAIPAALGTYYGNHKTTYVFAGDGGAQMNIQELNTIAKNNIPAKIFVFNNRALGNIRIFQENYLDNHFVATGEKEGDYFSCDFAAIANAYGIKGIKLTNIKELANYNNLLTNREAVLFEIEYEDCLAGPGIVAGGDFLKEGTGIPTAIVNKIKELMK
jgi:acetolactate synthase-1/2/3 large subunit